MPAKPKDEKPSVTLPGTVEKVIPPTVPVEPEKSQISVKGAEDLYKKIRVENTLHDENGRKVALKLGAEVDVTITADRAAVMLKDPPKKAPAEK